MNSALRNLTLPAVLLFSAAAASAAVDPALLNLLMPDTKILSGMQVQQSKNSPFGLYVLSQMQLQSPDFQKFISETGFDPRRDLNEIVGATSGENHGLLVGRGSFLPFKIVAAARAQGGTVTAYRGIDIVTGTEKNGNSAVAFPDATIAVIGDLDSVHVAIDRYRDGSAIDPVLYAKAKQISATTDAWFVTLAPLSDFIAGRVANPDLNVATQGNLLQAVLQATGGVHFGGANVQINGEALTRSDKDAAALLDVMKFLAGMIQLNRDKDPRTGKVASLLDTLTLTTVGSTLKLTLMIPEDQLEKMFGPSSSTKTLHASVR